MPSLIILESLQYPQSFIGDLPEPIWLKIWVENLIFDNQMIFDEHSIVFCCSADSRLGSLAIPDIFTYPFRLTSIPFI